ncbi:hypothetical protein F511_10884 [Dorcoceras hygrometricum]|uniref:Uncharacterized protein n=1 Tax=Dorcoceras hygrometricum TaxID=472368 RepID=A0A2Z7CLB6_9LAMI|nr:hypothetical protein F511_10884 [Dorcoceras hygrometricum]
MMTSAYLLEEAGGSNHDVIISVEEAGGSNHDVIISVEEAEELVSAKMMSAFLLEEAVISKAEVSISVEGISEEQKLSTVSEPVEKKRNFQQSMKKYEQ